MKTTTIYIIALATLLLFKPAHLVSQQQKTLVHWEFVKGDLGGVWEGLRYAPKGSQQEVPFWTEITVPHCYNEFDAVNPDVNYYEGPAWYRTSISPDLMNNQRVFLHFEGVGQRADVYVFDEKVGSHDGGYDEWFIDITNSLKRKKGSDYIKEYYNNRIPVLIRCDNSRNVERIPSDLSDFNLYGGIYRSVHLITKPEVHIQKVKVDPIIEAKKSEAKLRSEIGFYNPDGLKCEVDISLISPDNVLLYSHKETTTDSLYHLNTLVHSPKLWSPQSPALYTYVVKLSSATGTDSISEKIGFRSFEFVKSGPFKLNGERLLLRGTHRHEDHAGVAAAMTKEQIKSEMVLMKDMGVNFIRLGHYQQSKQVLQLCDSLGILVWEEIPWCRGGLGGKTYQNQARRMLTNLIEQHYNHPSVIIWGLGNENDWPGDFPSFNKDSIRSFMSELNDLAHQLDKNRKTAIRRCDFCKDIVDVYSPSIWAGWYRGKFTEYKNVSKQEADEVDHFLHVEWGASQHAGRHSENPDKGLGHIMIGQGTDERDGDASLYGGEARVSKDGDWTETYGCNLIDWHLKEQENMPWLTGTAYWPFKDFSTPVRPDNPIPYVNQKGVVERDLTPKEAFYVFQSYWTEKPMAHIYGHSWPVRWGKPDERKMVKVYSNCEEAELFLNGVSVGTKKRDSQNFPAAGLHWNISFKNGENQLKVLAKKGIVEVVDEISFYYETREWSEPHEIKIVQKKLESSHYEIEIIVVDQHGVVCLDAMNWVRFEYIGAGDLLADLGTSKGSRKIQLANGRAGIRIDTHHESGVLRVSVDGLESKFMTINTNVNE